MENAKVAVLIDADNAQALVAENILKEIARYGTTTVKRAYGDWTTPDLGPWKECLHRLAIQPMQQFRYTLRKNATDAALIIDAMDLLHAGNVDIFCLVSSDSDFTRLATRIRESGKKVYGFGEQKTPDPFVKACDKFVFTEILRHARLDKDQAATLEYILRPAVESCAREEGWALLAAVGQLAAKNHPSFDSRNYGCAKLGELVEKQAYLEVKSVPDKSGSPISHFYVRLKAPTQQAAT